MNKDLKLTPANENLFLDLGFDPVEASSLKIRTDLIIDLQEFIRSKNWTIDKTAEFFNETPSTINQLMNGDIDPFDIEQLITLLTKAGMEMRVEVFPKAA
jgi:predicted XRE-type DNA-binding protein